MADQFRCAICPDGEPFSSHYWAVSHVQERHKPILENGGGPHVAVDFVFKVDVEQTAAEWATISDFRRSLADVATGTDFLDACFDADRGRPPPVEDGWLGLT